MVFQCSSPNDGMSTIYLFSNKLRDTKQEKSSVQQGSMGQDTGVLVG